MTDRETKGQPEPVGWIVNASHERWQPVLRLHEEDARAYAELCRAKGFDAEARPLYDYDVPALLERLERLVEALERAVIRLDLWIGEEGDLVESALRKGNKYGADQARHRRGCYKEVTEDLRTALAAAQEEGTEDKLETLRRQAPLDAR